jgi:hypothetical protein
VNISSLAPFIRTKKLGGLFHGNTNQLKYHPIGGRENERPDTSSLEYGPVALGRQALLSVAPPNENMRPRTDKNA